MDDGAVDFLEVAPDNWIGVGGKFGEALDAARRHAFRSAPTACRCRWAGPSRWTWTLLARTREFNDRIGVALYSEHLSYYLRRRASVRPDADSLHRRGGASRRRAHPPGAGRAGPPHRGGERFLLRRAVPGAGARSISSTPCWPRPIATCCSTSTTSTSMRSTTVTTPRNSWRACRRDASPRTTSPATTTKTIDLKVDTHGAPVKADVWSLLRKRLPPLRRAPDAAGTRLQFPADGRAAGRNRHASARCSAACARPPAPCWRSLCA